MNGALPQVYLVRHGETAWTISRQHTRRTDIPLTERGVLRILAVRWIGLAPIEGRRLLPATASLSVLEYDHDLTVPVTHAWNGRITAAASAR